MAAINPSSGAHILFRTCGRRGVDAFTARSWTSQDNQDYHMSIVISRLLVLQLAIGYGLSIIVLDLRVPQYEGCRRICRSSWR